MDGVKSIAEACLQSGTIRRLIYTASMAAASPLKEDGSGFKDSMDETCWTPLDLSFAFSNEFSKDYTDSKTLAEKEILSYGNHNKRSGLEIVSLACGLVGGSSPPPFTHSSVAVLVSQLTNNAMEYSCLRFLEELVGKIPIVHIDDVCDAHIFCMESPSMNGRFFCTRSYVSSAQIASYYQQHYPELEVKQECLDLPKRVIRWGSTKLTEEGFVYKYDTKMILDDCITCARKWGSSSYLGSWLVKSLLVLEKGYNVHATVRNRGDASKVGLLKGLVPNGEHNMLRLFEADIYGSDSSKMRSL
ncbi:hypothetical protein ACLB2K_069435 [Fragaria x ananassa]